MQQFRQLEWQLIPKVLGPPTIYLCSFQKEIHPYPRKTEAQQNKLHDLKVTDELLFQGFNRA